VTRVICIGNPLSAVDSAGPQLFQRLQGLPLASEFELIDGGLQGLNLLRFFENCQRVILIDNVRGYLQQPGVILLKGADIESAVSRHFDHTAGLAYLLALLPQLLDQPPQLVLLGIEGTLNEKLAVQATEQLQRLLDDRSAA
jgi:hydrogenase maturation protease